MAVIQVLSDVHVEHHGVVTTLALIDPYDVDVLVVAGDVGPCRLNAWDTFYAAASERYAHVVAVLGNHEYYGSSRQEVLSTVQATEKAYKNVRFLRESAVEVAGITFAGGTGWFSGPTDYRFSDFIAIQGLDTWVRDENDRAREFLSTATADVIVTHHAPSYLSVRPKWQASSINHFFANNWDSIVATAPAKLWIHGHMHDPADYHVGQTRVICNPRGYPHEKQDSPFRRFEVDL